MGELAIVGGGIVGLALALNLHARGVRRRIFESSASASSSSPHAGFTLENLRA
jgi:2-polyprenyl-6-methoxyphenol hydroxylase-like FAD-dependent oxidoreductase